MIRGSPRNGIMQEKNVIARIGNAKTAVKADRLRVCSVGDIPASIIGMPTISTRIIKMKRRGIGMRLMYRSAPVSRARTARMRI
jgi:hypothetical protein